MKLEEAIKTAISYEIRIRDLYREARDLAKNQTRFRILKALAEEEELHVDYLQGLLSYWQRTGQLSQEKIKTILPNAEDIAAAIAKFDGKLAGPQLDQEQQMLQKAYECESETYSFYKNLVEHELEGEKERDMFERFLSIEEGHLSIVKAELDFALSERGPWLKFEDA